MGVGRRKVSSPGHVWTNCSFSWGWFRSLDISTESGIRVLLFCLLTNRSNIQGGDRGAQDPESACLGSVWALPTACCGTSSKLQRDPPFLSCEDRSQRWPPSPRPPDCLCSFMFLVDGRGFGCRHWPIASTGAREKQPPGLLCCFDTQVLAERGQPEN